MSGAVNARGRWIGVAAALIAGFAGGAAWREWRETQVRKAHPCGPVDFWEPNRQAWEQVFASGRDCTKLGPEVLVSGTWSDVAYGPRFVPDKANGFPSELDLSLEPLARYRLYWFAGLRGPPQAVSGRSFHVTVRGHVGRLDYEVTDGSQNLLFVDDVISVELLPKP